MNNHKYGQEPVAIKMTSNCILISEFILTFCKYGCQNLTDQRIAVVGMRRMMFQFFQFAKI